jgi:hypothetical protein
MIVIHGGWSSQYPVRLGAMKRRTASSPLANAVQKLAHHCRFIANQEDSVVRSSDHVKDFDTLIGWNLQ